MINPFLKVDVIGVDWGREDIKEVKSKKDISSGGNIQKKHNPSGHGKGRWHSVKTIKRSRVARDRKNKEAAKARRRNR